MANFSVNRSVWIGLAFATLVIISGAVSSVIAGHRIASLNLTASIEDYTGRRIVTSAAPIVEVFPSLNVEFQGVALHDWKHASDNYPVVNIQSLRLRLSLFSALTGTVRVTGATLERPVFYMKSAEENWQFPFSTEAKLAKLVAVAGLNPTEPGPKEAIAEARRQAFGSITISNGTIITPQILGSEGNTAITGLDARISWPTPGQASRLVAAAIWQGEKVQLDFDTRDLVLLIAGNDTKINANLAAGFANAQLSGNARLWPSPYFEGSFNAETNKLVDGANWQQLSNQLGGNQPRLTVSGQLKADARKWQLEDSKFLFGSNSGRGSLTVTPQASPPAISGTVDFEMLDLAMLKPWLFGNFSQPKAEGPTGLMVDLRVSAETATFDALALNNVAASIQVSAEASALDINQASIFGGNLQLSLKNMKNEPQAGSAQNSEIRILADNIDTKQLAGLGLIAEQLPEARGTVSAILRGPIGETNAFFERAEGTIKLRLSEGIMPGEESSMMIAELQRGGFIALDRSVGKKLMFTELNAEASLSHGNLQITPLKIGLSGATVDLSGAYAFKEDSFALTGHVSLETGQAVAGNTNNGIRVFVGGSRQSPIVSALPPEAQQINP